MLHFISVAVPGLLCGGGMMFMVIMMGRGSRNPSSTPRVTGGVADTDIAELRQEVARLRHELNERQHASSPPFP